MTPLKERFFKYVKKTRSCWLWTGSKSDDRYGHLRVNGKMIRSHRLSYMLHVGPIPHGKFICHACDVPACVKPSHLWPGTNSENILDSFRKGRSIRKATDNPRAKINYQIANRIRRLFKRGINQRDLARDFKVSQSTVSNVVALRSWI